MLTTPQLKAFYLDLQDDRLTSALGIVHSRFSTNTFPSWPLAHPFRRIAHNGEINTVTGNENWMRAREALIHTDIFGSDQDLEKIFPVCTPGASDTARFDEVLELLHLGGRSLPHAVLMMIPEAWERHESMDPARRAFYQYHASLMEPWDGPASMTFTDGTVIGAVLDRNGLRPSRIWVTDDGLVVMASEAGVLNLDPSTVVKKMRLQPGRMFLVDTAQGRIVSDEEIKAELAAEHPYQEWLDAGLFHLDELPQGNYVRMPHHRIVLRQQAFGYTYEELNLLVAPMARNGAEPLGSMGTDTPVAVLSQRPRMLFDYFQQLFAQVTNPPLDAIREEVVTSLQGAVGPEGDLLNPTRTRAARSCCRSRSCATTNWPSWSTSTPIRRSTAANTACAPASCAACTRSPRAARGCGARWTRCGPTHPPRSPTVHGSSCCPIGSPTKSWRPSRRCWPSPRCITTWCVNAPAPTSAWWWSRATRARCTTWPRWSASAPRRSTRTWHSSRSRTCSTAACSTASIVRRRCRTTSRPPARACSR